MKKITKMVAFGLALTMLTTGCGTPEPSSENKETTQTPTPTTAADSVEEGYSMEELGKIIEVARMGTTEKGLGVYYAASSDATIAILLIADPESKETASFVGQCEAVSDETIEITDESTGATFQARVIANEDGTWSMELGDEMGTATMAECQVSEVLDAMKKIDAGGIPVL